MTKAEKEIFMKSMTKKQLQQFFKLQRSRVGSGLNLGTRNMDGAKDYKKSREKRIWKKSVAEYIIFKME